MEENVALDSTEQNKFVKSVKGIKKLIKEGKIAKVAGNKPLKKSLKKAKTKRLSKKGLVYLSHIPHGFYEDEMRKYFTQFGRVTNVRVIRSKVTGKSKGHAFIEFSNISVAQIVAETMNNYLMGKRLLKANYIPPEEQRRAFRKNWNAQNNPTSNYRQTINKKFNENKSEEEDLQYAKKMIIKTNKLKRKLNGMDVDYSFFSPVDVPPELLDFVKLQDKESKKAENTEGTKVTKKDSKRKQEESVEESKPKKLKVATEEPIPKATIVELKKKVGQKKSKIEDPKDKKLEEEKATHKPNFKVVKPKQKKSKSVESAQEQSKAIKQKKSKIDQKLAIGEVKKIKQTPVATKVKNSKLVDAEQIKGKVAKIKQKKPIQMAVKPIQKKVKIITASKPYQKKTAKVVEESKINGSIQKKGHLKTDKKQKKDLSSEGKIKKVTTEAVEEIKINGSSLKKGHLKTDKQQKKDLSSKVKTKQEITKAVEENKVNGSILKKGHLKTDKKQKKVPTPGVRIKRVRFHPEFLKKKTSGKPMKFKLYR